jgi:butyryl-CoA dehydrogenase
MGYRGITNTILNFGEGAFRPGGESGAVGYLVGEMDHGMDAMFHMMNEARVAVGAGAVALGYTGYLHALNYARSRPQGRPAGAKDPSSSQVPIIKHPDVRRMLLASKCYVEGGLALVLYCSRLLDEVATGDTPEDRRSAALLLDVLTPIAKSWPSRWCLVANDHAIQVHGGYGYSREYPVEQFYRDNRLNAIHEGTHGIQAIDLLGRKVLMQDGAGLAALADAIRSTIAHADGDLAPLARQLDAVTDRIMTVTKQLWARGDPATALANASTYLDAMGDIAVAWMWLEQAIAAGNADGDFYEGKRTAARHFFTYELPRVHPQLDLLESLDRSLVDLDDACL